MIATVSKIGSGTQTDPIRPDLELLGAGGFRVLEEFKDAFKIEYELAPPPTQMDHFKEDASVAALTDDAAWGKMTSDERQEHLRHVLLGVLGIQINKPDLVAKAVDAMTVIVIASHIGAEGGK